MFRHSPSLVYARAAPNQGDLEGTGRDGRTGPLPPEAARRIIIAAILVVVVGVGTRVGFEFCFVNCRRCCCRPYLGKAQTGIRGSTSGSRYQAWGGQRQLQGPEAACCQPIQTVTLAVHSLDRWSACTCARQYIDPGGVHVDGCLACCRYISAFLAGHTRMCRYTLSDIVSVTATVDLAAPGSNSRCPRLRSLARASANDKRHRRDYRHHHQARPPPPSQPCQCQRPHAQEIQRAADSSSLPPAAASG